MEPFLFGKIFADKLGNQSDLLPIFFAFDVLTVMGIIGALIAGGIFAFFYFASKFKLETLSDDEQKKMKQKKKGALIGAIGIAGVFLIMPVVINLVLGGIFA